MKFTIIGAGSSYTPELFEEIANRKNQFDFKEIFLYDINSEKLDIMTDFCRRFLNKLNVNIRIQSTTDLYEALYGADFVDIQIRVGGNKQRILDEKIPLKHGLIGQETTGIGGMMKAFRTIPVVLDIANKLFELSPDAWIINYTNPTGLITEAVTKYTNVRIAGLCSGGLSPKVWAKESLGVSFDKVKYDYVGLNHLNFMSNITIDGKPINQEEFLKIAEQNHGIDIELSKLLGVLTSPYLHYYYHTSKCIEYLAEKTFTRGEEVLELEKEIFEELKDMSNKDKPKALIKRGGGGYSEVAFNFLNAVFNNIDSEMIINVPNNGAIDFLPDSAVVEIGCLVNKSGIKPLHAANIPEFCRGIIAAVKSYEQLAVEAAVEGDLQKAKLALLSHPLVRDYDLIEKVLPELFEANKEYLKQFIV